MFPPLQSGHRTDYHIHASSKINPPISVLLTPPPDPHFPFLVMKPIHIWNSYRGSGQRVLAILSLSVVASLHSLNTKCDCIWDVREIKSADVLQHRRGISATSWTTLFHTCAREVQILPTVACTRLGSQLGLEGRSTRVAGCCRSQHPPPFPGVDLKGR